mgnify:FL=1
MASTIERTQATGVATTDEFLHAIQTFTGTGSTDPVRLARDIVVQLSGTATAVDAVLERSFADPTAANSWAPAEDEHFTGDLSAALVAARGYFEPIQAYYRVRVISLTGGNCTVSIVGSSAQ